jgi:predicted  nucleic acid-binding Zn-ribbon protein
MDTHRAMSVNMQSMGSNLQSMGTSLQSMGTDLRDAIQVSKSANSQTVQAVADIRAISANLAAAQTQFLASLSHERGSTDQHIQEMHTAMQSLQQTYQALDQSITHLAQLIEKITRTP